MTTTNNLKDQPFQAYVFEEDYSNLPVDIDPEFLDENKVSQKDNENIEETLEKFAKESILKHPRVIKNGLPEKYPLCSSTGAFGCCNQCSNSDFDKLGIGIVTYFKILKAWLIAVFIIVLINIPILVIYTQSHPERLSTSFQDNLFRTTIGNIASRLDNCDKVPTSKIRSNGLLFKNTTITLDCDHYIIASINKFGISPDSLTDISNQQECIRFSSASNITVTPDCSMTDQIASQINDCIAAKRTTCDVTFYSNNFLRDCKGEENMNYFYLTYTCLDENIPIFNWLLLRDNAAFIIVIIDAISIIIIFTTSAVISKSSSTSAKKYYQEVNQISDYTIHLQNLNLDTNCVDKELSEILIHFNNVIKYIPDISNDSEPYLYDVNYPYISDDMVDLVLKKQNLYDEKQSIIRTIAFDKNIDENKRIKLIKTKEKIESKYEKVNEEFHKSKLEVKELNDVWITFNKMKYSKRIVEEYSRYAKCDRCCLILCCQKKKIQYLYFKDKWIDVDTKNTLPSNYKWANINYSPCKRLLRSILSFIIALILILGSFFIVVYAKYAQKTYVQKYNTNIPCAFVSDYNNTTLIANSLNTNVDVPVNRARQNCYCKAKLKEFGNNIFEMDHLYASTNNNIDYNLCSDWLQLYLQYESLNYAIIILIPVINAIFIILLTFLTRFERNKNINDDLFSNMFKCFISQFLNTIIVLILVNAYVESVYKNNKDFFILTGLFKDLEPDWFNVVGVTIALSMLINIVTPHLSAFLYYLVYSIRRCFDTGCCKSKRSKKLTKKDYFSLYVGPEFRLDTRYAQTLTTFFVVNMFAPGIPILYVFLFFYLFCIFWTDKILIINFYKNPPQYDIFLSSAFNNVIIFSLIIHTSFGIWIYGNPDYFSTSNGWFGFFNTVQGFLSDYLSFLNSEFGKDIKYRITLPHNLILLLLLIILVSYAIIKLFFINLIWFLCCVCCSNKVNVIEDLTQNLPIQRSFGFNKFYADYQIKKLKLRKIFRNEKESLFIKRQFVNSIANDRYYLIQILKEHNFPFNKEFSEAELSLHVFNNKILDNDQIMIGDLSYNLVYDINLESCAYNFLLKDAGLKNWSKISEMNKNDKILITEEGEIKDKKDEKIKEEVLEDINDNKI